MRSLKASLIALALVMAGGVGAAYAQPVIPEIGDTTNQAKEEANKAAILRLYTSAFGDPAVVAELTGPDAVTHNGETTGAGPAGLTGVFDAIKAAVPGATATVAHATADGDFVAIHWHASATPDDKYSGNTVADVYKLNADGKIIEVWSASMPIVRSVSGNDPFSDLYVYPNGKPVLTEAEEEANRQREMDFNRDVDGTNFSEAGIRAYWADDLIQHNFTDPNGNEKMIEQFAGNNAVGPPPGGPPPDGGPGGPPAGAAPAGGPPPGGAPGGPPPGGGFQTVGYFADDDLVWEVNMIQGEVLIDIYRMITNKAQERYVIQSGAISFPGAPAQ